MPHPVPGPERRPPPARPAGSPCPAPGRSPCVGASDFPHISRAPVIPVRRGPLLCKGPDLSYSLTAPQITRMLGEWRAAGPAYCDLAEAFHVLITDGRLPVGARLPAERTLAAECGISRNTVTAAYRLLREKEYLASDRGAGSFVRLPEGVPRSDPPEPGAPHTDLGRPARTVDLTVASLPAPALVLGAATRNASGDLDQYSHLHGYDVVGAPELRRAIAAGFARRGVPTDPDQILVTTGADHALGLVVRLLSRPGDAVLTDSPTYPHALDIVRRLNRRPLTVGLGADGWNLDVWESALRQEKPRLAYLTPDFHNPTGLVMPAAARSVIADASRRSGTYLVVDEAMRELSLDGRPLPPPMASYSTPGHIITIGTLSKTCWTGLRVGWIRASKNIVARLAGLRRSGDTPNSILTQLIGLRVLESNDELLDERRELLVKRRQVLVDLLGRHFPDWRFTTPGGGLSLWVDLGARLGPALARAAGRRAVRIYSGGRFGEDGTLDNHIRIPYVADEESLAEGCERLAEAWAEVCGAGGQVQGRMVTQLRA
jgi:DNA-binding transcriptional MocR family regulator